MTASTVSVEIPYGLAVSDLKLDTRDLHLAEWDTLLNDLAAEYTADEAERVLRATVCLYSSGVGTLQACLDTAMTWERG